MSKAERLAQQIEALEAEYRARFTQGLRACANGQWGFFSQNDLPARLRPPVVGELSELADRINKLRRKLGDAPYAMHERYFAACGRKEGNQAGEPKQAARWLQEIDG